MFLRNQERGDGITGKLKEFRMAVCSEERVWEDLVGCLNWAGPVNNDGYGKWGNRMAHRVVYEMHNGPIPDGFWIDHLCTNRRCIRLDHLDAVTPRVNILRSSHCPSAVNARKTYCDHGHPFDTTNTYRRPDGGRACRKC